MTGSSQLEPFRDVDMELFGSEAENIEPHSTYVMTIEESGQRSTISMSGVEYAEFVKIARQNMVMVNGSPILDPIVFKQFFEKREHQNTTSKKPDS